MTYLEHVVALTKGASKSIFSSARAMPEDKLNWKPLDEGRSTLDLLREVSMSPLWFAPMMTERGMPNFTEEDQQKGQQLMETWKTVDDCEKACQKHSELLFQTLKAFPENELSKVIHLPFGPEGFDASLAEVAMFQYWNLTYHCGQINYIQTLYGDKEMH